MSNPKPMMEEELAAIEMRANATRAFDLPGDSDFAHQVIAALVAEVRRQRDVLDRVAWFVAPDNLGRLDLLPDEIRTTLKLFDGRAAEQHPADAVAKKGSGCAFCGADLTGTTREERQTHFRLPGH